MPTSSLQNICLAVIIGTPLLASCFVALRVYARKRRGIRVGWDDYLILLATVLSIALIGPSVRNVYMWHIGIHIWEVPRRPLEPNFDEYFKVVLAFNMIHTPIISLVKASIVLLLLRAAYVIKSLQRALYIILGFIILSCLGPMIALIFRCPMRTGSNNAPTVYNGLSCITNKQAETVGTFLVSVNMLTDVLIFPIPILLMKELKNTMFKSRLMVVLSFFMMLGATAIGAIRLQRAWALQMPLNKKSSDWTYEISFCLSHAENNAAIVLACLPPLRSLLLNWSRKPDEESRLQNQPKILNQVTQGESRLFHTIILREQESESVRHNEPEATNVPERLGSDNTLMEWPLRPRGQTESSDSKTESAHSIDVYGGIPLVHIKDSRLDKVG